MNTQELSHGEAVPAQKPRLVLMGEFSSGKSTLSNLLLGAPILPTQVTATRLPPVFVSYGAPSAFAVRRDGTSVPADLSDLAALTPEAFSALHVTMESGLLELCDLVDMPGISDPNMPLDTWDAVIGAGDHVIWCTHATQAWRQSEAAMWARLRPATAGRNLLVVTQIDKLRTPRERDRVLARLAGETAGAFPACYPVALLSALAAGEDFASWQDSGAHALMECVIDLIMEPEGAALPAPPAPTLAPTLAVPAPSNVVDIALPRRAIDASPAEPGRPAVRPRRVQARAGSGRAPRPEAAQASEGPLG